MLPSFAMFHSPFSLGDRITIAAPAAVANPGPAGSWFVEGKPAKCL